MTARIAAAIGGGVIGGGWISRFLLNGWTVRVYDPAPNARERLDVVINNARIAMPATADVPFGPEGELQFVGSLEEAVLAASWIQESVPERLEVKLEVLNAIQSACQSDAIVASSTSGFKPSELREGSAQPEQIIVAHPFNPVYLLPVVELVGGIDNAYILRASSVLHEIGMKPIVVRREIDAHVADRLLEAVWREALWLVKDDVATTGEIDDIMRYGFGLRWAQMGLFETYRLAGGEEGMAHFLHQFGPALAWPWTKLMDVPELTDELIDKIAGQSDSYSGQHSIAELERIRDNNLVGILRALKERRWGAGKLLAVHDKRLQGRAENSIGANNGDNHERTNEGVRIVQRCEVLPAWIDYNGHMTEFRYLQVFADSSDLLLVSLGFDEEYRAQGYSFYTVETHIMHVDEAAVNERIYSTIQILHADEKRMKVFQSMHRAVDHAVLATAEQMYLHVDTKAGKACPATIEMQKSMNELASEDAGLPIPVAAGRAVGQSIQV